MSLKGISERYCELKIYSSVGDERILHAHLYNTLIDERLFKFEKFHRLESECKCLVLRELIKSEISCLYSSIILSINERLCVVSIDNTFSSEMTCITSPIDNILFERNLIEENVEFIENRHFISYRSCICLSDNLFSDVICFVNSIRYTERYFDCKGIITQSIANERYGFASNNETFNFSVRNALFEGYGEKITFNINPPSQNISSFKINQIEQQLIPKKQVLPSEKITSVKVLTMPDNFNIGDMFFTYVPRSKNDYKILNMTTKPLHTLYSNILGSNKNLYYIDGKFLFTREPVYISIFLNIYNYDDEKYTSSNDYYKNYIMKYRHLLINFNGVEYTNVYGYFEQIHIPVNTLIPFEVYLSSEMVLKGNNTLIVRWCYPYEMTTIYDSHFYII